MTPNTQISLQWAAVPNNLHTIHANQIAVVFTGAEYYLIFGEVQIPPVIDESTPLNITPVARIAIPIAAMPAIVQAIQQSLQHSETTTEEENQP